MQWSTVSNAALKSNSTKTAQFPESTNNNKSFTTLKKADSVLCLDLKPDWKGSNILLSKVIIDLKPPSPILLIRMAYFEIGL